MHTNNAEKSYVFSIHIFLTLTLQDQIRANTDIGTFFFVELRVKNICKISFTEIFNKVHANRFRFYHFHS